MSDLDPKQPQAFITGEWVVDPSRNLVVRGEEERRLEPRVMDALVYLAERQGRVISKDELIRSIWQDRCVTDDVLTVTICSLRKVLGDDARRPQYVETVSRRGYRWLLAVFPAATAREELPKLGSDNEKNETSVAALDWPVSRLVAIGMVLALVASVVWIARSTVRYRHVALAEAREAYLKGRFFLDQRSIQGWRQALEQFERAAAVDPRDPAAKAGLADTYSAMADFGVASPRELRPRAFQYAELALELDRNSAEAYEALGRAQFLFDWDFLAAERNLAKALSLNSDYMPTYQAMAWLKSAQGKQDEAVKYAQHALQLDPVNIARYTELAWVLALGGEYEPALDEIERALALNPRSFEAYLMKGWISDLSGNSAASFQAYYEGLRRAGVPDERLMRIKSVYRTNGLPGYYRNWLDAQRRGGKMPMSSTFRAQLYIHAGQSARALDCLEEAYEKHEGALAWVNVEPSFQSLRSEPRFQVIAARVGNGFPSSR